jgi:uncharacterized protein (DUF433 family)
MIIPAGGGAKSHARQVEHAAGNRNPEIMHGVPVFRGTRVPVQAMFDYIAGGDTLEGFLEGFPTVPRDLALQVLDEAKQLVLAQDHSRTDPGPTPSLRRTSAGHRKLTLGSDLGSGDAHCFPINRVMEGAGQSRKPQQRVNIK